MEIVRKTILNDEKYLRQISQPVDLDNESYKEEIKLLEQFCLKNECFALAAIQIGIPKRIIYLKNTTLDIPLEIKKHNESKVLINPIAISRRGHTRYWEACLSCLDNMGLVSRPYEITVKYYDTNGNENYKIFEGFEATVLSHELDHLDGILHIDIAEEILNLPKEKRKAYRKKHPYEIISKSCNYDEKIYKTLKHNIEYRQK